MSQWSWTWRWRSILDSERLAVGLTRNICIEYYRETVATHSKTVKKIIQDIHDRRLLLPAIQRKYVWDAAQVVNLFDSMMRGYPIGTFLFWKVDRKNAMRRNYSFYDFLSQFNERNHYQNELSSLATNSHEEFEAALDGQQRLTSIYLALSSTFAFYLKGKWRSLATSYPETELYLDLCSGIANTDQNDEENTQHIYRFELLRNEVVEDAMTTVTTHLDKGESLENDHIWLNVKKGLDDDTAADFQVNNSQLPREVMSQAIKNINRLHQVLSVEEALSFFEVESDSIDEVLDIFVRTNSGGTVLSKADLLFSTVIAQWPDARENIDKLLNAMNEVGDGFRFSSDFLLRACLYIVDHSTRLRVESFSQDHILEIRENWRNLKKTFKSLVGILADWGYSRENLGPQNALFPIVYYIYHASAISAQDNKNMRLFYIYAQLKQTFSHMDSNPLRLLRDELKEDSSSFNLTKLQQIHFSNGTDLKFMESDIDQLFTYPIGNRTFDILSLLYQGLKYRDKQFHQDHLHPHSSFEDVQLNNLMQCGQKLPDTGDDIRMKWEQQRDTIVNLHLLEGHSNESKNDRPLASWVLDPIERQWVECLPNSLPGVPPDETYWLMHFEQFFDERRRLMKDRLMEILQVKSETEATTGSAAS